MGYNFNFECLRQIWITLARMGLDFTDHSTDDRPGNGYHSPGDKIPARSSTAPGVYGMRFEQYHRQVFQKSGKVPKNIF